MSKKSQNTTSKAHCFTINWSLNDWMPTDELQAKCLEIQQSPGFRYLCFQKEIAPSTGQRHYQGYINWGANKRFKAAKELLFALFNVQPHLEPARGSPQKNKDYCSKEGGTDFTEFGTFPKQGARSDLSVIAKAVLDGNSLAQIARQFPSDFIKFHNGIKAFQALTSASPRDINVEPSVYWLYGPTGVGKSRMAFEKWPTAYVKSVDGIWWDGYKGEQTVIIDDYRPSMCPFHMLLRILDRYPLRVQQKGTSIELSATVFVITTCSRPEIVWQGRTEEALAQLLRRITHIIKFDERGNQVVEKDKSIPTLLYVPIKHTPIADTFILRK